MPNFLLDQNREFLKDASGCCFRPRILTAAV
jgi:hypothetical protein